MLPIHPLPRRAARPAGAATTPWRAALLAGCLLAAAGGSAAQSSAQARYEQERAACLSGRSSQDRATCLKEAGAARAEARRGRLDNGEDAAQLRANALQRCQRVPAADRSACERLALGEGQRSGSVAEGAVVKQLTERVVGPLPAASGAAAGTAAATPAAANAPAAPAAGAASR